MAKRPQKRSAELTAPQLEQPQFQVQARPVDTAIKPSTAGAPAAPQMKQDAVKPDLEPAREMQRMGQALGALSGTVRDLVQLEKIRTDEFYTDAVNLATETDLSIAELMESGKLTGTSPAHIRGYSRAAATGQLLNIAKTLESSEALIRSQEDALDPDYINRYVTGMADKMRQAVKKSGLDYGHFNKAFNTGLGGLLEKANARHSKWAGEEHQNRAASNLTAELELAFRGMWDSDDPLKQAKFRQHVAELVEGRADGVLTRRATHQLMGQAAVDLIINMPEAEAAMNAVLDDVPIGPGVPDDFFTPRSGMDQLPIDSRKGRLGKIAEVRNYRTDKGPQIATATGGRASSKRRAALGGAQAQLGAGINTFAIAGALDAGATFSSEQVIQDAGGLVAFVTERADELGIDLESDNGYTITYKDDNSVLLVDKVTGDEKTIPVRTSIDNARTNLWRNLAGEGMDRERQVQAALSTGSHIPKAVVAENKRRIESGLNASFAVFAQGGGFDANTLDELLEVHQVWEGMQGVGLGLDYVGDMGNHLLMRAISRSRRLIGPAFKSEQDALESLAATLFTRRQEAGGTSLSVAADELERQLGTVDAYEGAAAEIKFLTKTLMLMDDTYRNAPNDAITEARNIYKEQYDSPFGDLSTPIFKPLLYGENPGQYHEIKEGMRKGGFGMVRAIEKLDSLVFTEEDITRNKTVDMADLGVSKIHVMPNPRDPTNPTYRFRLEGGGHFEFAVNRINGEGNETTTFLSHNEMLQFLARRPAALEEIRSAAEARKASIANTQGAIRGAAIDEFLTRLLPFTGPGFEAELEGYDIQEVYEGKPRKSRIRSGNPLAELIRDFSGKSTEKLFAAMSPRQRRMMYHPDLLLAARQLPKELKDQLPQFRWMWNRNAPMPKLLERRGGMAGQILPSLADEELGRSQRFETDINQNMLYGVDGDARSYERNEREQLIYDMLSESPRFLQNLSQGGITRTRAGDFEYVNPVQRYKRTQVEGRITKPDELFDLHVAYYYNTQLSPEQKELLGPNFKFLEFDYPYGFYEVEDSFNRVVDPQSSLKDSE